MNKSFLEAFVEIKLDTLSKYTITIEELLRSKADEYSAWVDEEAKKILTKEAQDDFCDFYSDEYWELTEEFPNILRYSLFVMCYTFLEHELISLCKYIRRNRNYEISHTDIKGNGIFKAKTYLKKVAKIEFPDQITSWGNIVNYNKIRNLIVHNDGLLDSEKKYKEMKKLIETNELLITISEQRKIMLSEKSCPEVIKDIESFFKELFKSYPEESRGW